MNWKLIAGLSAFGLLMGVGSVLGATGDAEPLLWFAVAVVCALTVARSVPVAHYRHGFLVGVFSVLIASCLELLFFDAYMAANPDRAEMLGRLPGSLGVRTYLMLLTPVFAALFGVVWGVLSWVARRILVGPEAPYRR
jgi:hypothetical protein